MRNLFGEILPKKSHALFQKPPEIRSPEVLKDALASARSILRNNPKDLALRCQQTMRRCQGSDIHLRRPSECSFLVTLTTLCCPGDQRMMHLP